ncbi:hypothetical protein EI172_13140 [Psychrobacter sp. FME2]|nr:hypothetical protein [Pseudomonas lundensis]
MAKRTKFSKFRSLYEVIEGLLDTYTHEGVVEILAESHDLELSVSTLRSYLYRYKKQSKELSVATANPSTKTDIKHNIIQQNLGKSKDGEPNKDNNLDVDRKRRKRATPDELKEALEKMKNEMAEDEYNWRDLL